MYPKILPLFFCLFVCFYSSTIVAWISWKKETFEDLTDFPFFTIFWHFIHQTTNRLITTIIIKKKKKKHPHDYGAKKPLLY